MHGLQPLNLPMSWSFLPARRRFADHAPAWDALNERLHGGHPLLGTDFVAPLLRHFADDDVVLAVHGPASAPDAMLLLVTGKFKWQSFLPSQTQIAPALLERADCIASLRRALPRSVLALDVLCQDPLYSPLPTAPADLVHERVVQATTMQVRLDTSFEVYWSARSSNLRQSLRRALRGVEGTGHALRRFSTEDEVDAALARYAGIEMRGWKGRLGTAIDLATTQGRFYREMLARRAYRDGAQIVELHLGDRLAASLILLRGRSMVITLKSTHDEELAKHAPGYMLDYLVLQQEFEARRVPVVEYYTNASQDLLRWGTAQRDVTSHRWYRASWLRRLVQLARRRPSMSKRPAPNVGAKA